MRKKANDRRSTDVEKAALREALKEALIVSHTAAEDIRSAARRAGMGDVVDEHDANHPVV